MNVYVNDKKYKAGPGNVMSFLQASGIVLNAPCGGQGRCGKCKIIIANPAEATEAERAFLSIDEISTGCRLACLTALFPDMHIHISNDTWGQAQIMVAGRERVWPLEPIVKTKNIQLPPPSLEDQRDDATRLLDACGAARVAPRLLREMPRTLRQQNFTGKAVYLAEEVIGFTRNDEPVLGLAVDIGTTTLAAYLLDLETGRRLASTSSLNPQKAYGDDVIIRSDYARDGGLVELQSVVSQRISQLAADMCRSVGMEPASIYAAAVAGNTVMMHLFRGVDPQFIAVEPFTPGFVSGETLEVRDTGLTGLNMEARVVLIDCVAGYIGADTVAAMLCCEMDTGAQTALLIDIGTNGELVLSHQGKRYACSTAAGPAFEGAHISCGMGGIPGAIGTVSVQDGLRYTTVGNAQARGLCGSGLLDAVAVLLEQGGLDTTGRLSPAEAGKEIASRVSEERFMIDEALDIALTQRDIREVQLAKGAIAAGIDILAEQADISLSDIEAVYLAGGFGSYLNKSSACRIGMIPKELEERTVAIGNGAGIGAQAVLLSEEALRVSKGLAKRTQYIELSANDRFQDAFIENMMF